MSSARFDLITHLNQQFKNKDIEKIALESSQQRLKSNDATRVFDEFPSLLPDSLIEYLTSKFNLIIAAMHEHAKTQENLQLPRSIQSAIIHYQKEIARVGRLQLFDKSGHVNKALVDLCQWHQYKNKLDPCDILCAFVGAVNQEIMKNEKLVADLFSHQLAAGAMLTFINKYRNWVKEVLDEAQIEYIGKKAVTHPPYHLQSDAAPLTVGLITGFATAVALGVTLFGHYAAKDNPLSKPNLKPRRP